ncbi:MAG: argB [Rickettsiales bacterium]|jgi:acetylglutamate kinase|nr:argB [Rickettsiales bacterium]
MSKTKDRSVDAYKNKEWLAKAKTLAEALPYMREFSGQTFVVKYGGHAMGDRELSESFARDIVLLKQVGINPVVVHGGGPQISQLLDQLKIKSKFIDGLRVTDRETVAIVEMVLSGSINKQIVSDINAAGGAAVGLSGKDGMLIEARKIRRTKSDPGSNIEKILDLGFVGEPTMINPDILMVFEESDVIPVIAPIGVGENGETYNINADSVAGAIASALAASKLIMLTDVPGVLNANKELLSTLTTTKAKAMIKDGTINGGMIPKVETCISALDHHTEAAHILDGKIPHVLLLEVFTEHGAGTMIMPD